METTQTTITKIKEVTLPNLFDYATSELSQDAFVSWLLMWGNTEFEIIEPALHSIACKMIKAMVGESIEVKSVEVKQQEAHIDVLAIVKDTNDIQYAIIIEDKTDTSEHSNQLRNYTTYVSDKYKNHIIKCVYYKSGNECKSKIQKMTNNYNTGSNKLKIITRTEILKILRSEVCDNLILQSYIAYLVKIEELTDSYKENPVSNWGSRAWEGFCMALEKELEVKFEAQNKKDDYQVKWLHSPHKTEDKKGKKHDVIEFSFYTLPPINIEGAEIRLFIQIKCCKKYITGTRINFCIEGLKSIAKDWIMPKEWKTAITIFKTGMEGPKTIPLKYYKDNDKKTFAYIKGKDFFGTEQVDIDEIADKLVQWHKKLQALAGKLSETEATQSNK